MTELSRRSFVKAGGALIVGVAFAQRATTARAAPAIPPTMNLSAVDTFLAVRSDNTVDVMSGRVELGQGTSTGLLILVAEELGVGIDQLTFVRHDTSISPDTGGTYGSSSMALAGPELRSAAATARQALLGLASTQLGVPVASLTVKLGVVSSGARSITYGELIGDRLFNVEMIAPSIAPGVPPSRPVSSYTLVGIADVPRIDIPAKVSGAYTYIQNVVVPGMLHGRIVRPRGQGAYGEGTASQILSIDERSIASIGDARIVRRDNFLGVVASQEYDAIQAAAQLEVVYADPPAFAGNGDMYGQMRTFDSEGLAPAATQQDIGDVDAAIAAAAHSVAASYSYDYQAHVPIGPSCAVADVTPTSAIVLTNTQDAFRVRSELVGLLGLPLDAIRVQYWEGASCFGNAPARYDAAEAAAVMSQLSGASVRLQYMRWDEHGWDNYSPAFLADVRAAADASGKLVGFDYSVLAIPEMAGTGVATIQNTGLPLDPPGIGLAAIANSGTQYDIANRRVTGKSLPLWNTYFKTSALRGPLTPQTCFACEQMIDELAHAAQVDPYLFRLQNATVEQVNDGFAQWHDALVGVANLAGWEPRVAASDVTAANLVTGRGIAIGGFAGSQVGVVAKIAVDRTTGKIQVRKMYAAQVAGLTVYLGGVSNQLEGNLVMGTSRALLEQVVDNTRRVTSLDWSTYPILRIKDSPAVTTAIVQRTDLAPTGSGEPTQAPIAAAIANAFFDATGVRIRQAPMTPGRVRAVLAA